MHRACAVYAATPVLTHDGTVHDSIQTLRRQRLWARSVHRHRLGVGVSRYTGV